MVHSLSGKFRRDHASQMLETLKRLKKKSLKVGPRRRSLHHPSFEMTLGLLLATQMVASPSLTKKSLTNFDVRSNRSSVKSAQRL